MMEQIQTQTFEKKYTNNGYIKIFIDGEWRLEHKYILEQYLGRSLNREEVIHHINGFRQDNRISNLMLFPNQKEHQKFHLKIKQFGYTNPVKRRIANRFNNLEVEDD